MPPIETGRVDLVRIAPDHDLPEPEALALAGALAAILNADQAGLDFWRQWGASFGNAERDTHLLATLAI